MENHHGSMEKSTKNCHFHQFSIAMLNYQRVVFLLVTSSCSKVLLQNQSRELRVLVSAWGPVEDETKPRPRVVDVNHMGKAQVKAQSPTDWSLPSESTACNLKS